MSSPFQPYRPWAAASGPPPARVPAAPQVAAAELTELRRTTVRLSKKFAVANAVFLGVMVLLACTADGLLGTEVVGRLNLGMLLGLVQGVLLLATATRFDRASAKEPDRAADRLADRTAAWEADGRGRGGAYADAWPAEPSNGGPGYDGQPSPPYGRPQAQGSPSYSYARPQTQQHRRQPAQAQQARPQTLSPEQLYRSWDDYLYGGDRPDVRPADNGSVGQ